MAKIMVVFLLSYFEILPLTNDSLLLNIWDQAGLPCQKIITLFFFFNFVNDFFFYSENALFYRFYN